MKQRSFLVISEEEDLAETITAIGSLSEENLLENSNNNICERAYTHISTELQTAPSSVASKLSSSEGNLLENSKENVFDHTRHATSISGELPTASLFSSYFC